MTVTVAEALQLPVLSSAIVVAGKDRLGNAIRWAHVSELLDIAYLLSGGELLLTTGLTLAISKDVQLHYLRELAEKGVAGVAIELGRSFQEIPHPMIDLANELHLPLIALTREVRFVEVTEEIHSLIIRRQYAALRRAEQVGKKLAAVTMDEQGIPGILRALSEVIRASVLYLPRRQGEDAASYPTHLAQDQALVQALQQQSQVGAALPARPRAVAIRVREEALRVLLAPVHVGPEHWAELVAIESLAKLREPDSAILHQATVTLAYEVLRQKGIEETRRGLKTELFDHIASGSFSSASDEEICRRADYLGVDLRDKWMAVGVFHCQGLSALAAARDQGETQMRDLKRGIEEHLKACFNSAGLSAMTSVRGESVRALFADNTREQLLAKLQILVAGLHDDVARGYPGMDLVAGIGRAVNRLGNVWPSYQEAEFTAAICKRCAAASPEPFFDSLGIYRLFFNSREPEELARFVHDELGPLLDCKDATALLDTLRTVLDCNLNMVRAANLLGLGRQGLYCRLNRIARLLRTDLRNPEKQNSIRVALRAKVFLDSSQSVQRTPANSRHRAS